MDKELASVKKSLSSFVVKSRAKENSINQIKHSIKKIEREIEVIRGESSQVNKVCLILDRNMEIRMEGFRA